MKVDFSLLKENKLNIQKESFMTFMNGFLKTTSLIGRELYERIANANPRYNILYESPERLVCELNIKDSDIFVFLIFDAQTGEAEFYLYPKKREYFPLSAILKKTDQDYVQEHCVRSSPLNYWRIINLLVLYT